MCRLLIFGNSASGKSTLARALADRDGLAHLDLDTLAWQSSTPPERRTLEASWADMEAFITGNDRWVLEGCYADLLELALPSATELRFLDLPVSICLANAKRRPWEPHKYDSPEAQNANLGMLLEWIGDYDRRKDACSRAAHRRLYDRFTGPRRRHTCLVNLDS